MKRLFVIFTAAAIASSAPAATKIVKEKGKPFQVIYDDGRVAELVYDRESVLTVEFPFGLDENTCNSTTKIHCSFTTSFRIDRFMFRWAAHPDSKKVGQPIVKKLNKDATLPIQDFMFQQSGKRLANFPSVMDMPADEMKCESYAWIPGVGEEVPESLTVPRWDCEEMQQNPETGFSENRVVASTANIQWKKSSKGSLSADKARMLGPRLSIFQGDIIALVHKMPNGEFCQQSLKADGGKVSEQINNYFAKIKDDYVPYLYGTDEYVESTDNIANIFLKDTDAGDIQ